MAEENFDYEPMNPIELEDEEGKIHRFDQLDYLRMNGNEYVALVPIRSEESTEEEEGQLFVMKVVHKNGADHLFFIEDDAELDRVSDQFIERLSEDYDIVNDDEEPIEVIR